MRPEVVVITGASAGVGRTIAWKFASEGAHLLLIARGIDALEATKLEVESRGGKAWIYPADVANPQEMYEAADYAEKNIGPIDIWINNAMVSVFSKVVDMNPNEYKRVTEVTYLGQVYGTLAALSKMKLQGYGHIILVGSALAFRGIPLQSAYCGSKHAIQGFFESLRSELMHDRLNIKLSIVHLPAMNTTQFGWVKSRLSRKPRPMGKIFEPEVAANAIYEVAHDGQRQRLVAFPTVQTVWGNRLVPEYLDEYMATHGFDGQLTEELEDPDRKDNLYEPVPGDHGAHGTFSSESTNFSWYDTIVENKKSIGVAGLALLGLAMARFLTRK